MSPQQDIIIIIKVGDGLGRNS